MWVEHYRRLLETLLNLCTFQLAALLCRKLHSLSITEIYFSAVAGRCVKKLHTTWIELIFPAARKLYKESHTTQNWPYNFSIRKSINHYLVACDFFIKVSAAGKINLGHYWKMCNFLYQLQLLEKLILSCVIFDTFSRKWKNKLSLVLKWNFLNTFLLLLKLILASFEWSVIFHTHFPITEKINYDQWRVIV